MSVAAVDPKHNVTGNRQAYYDKISKKDMAPLWEVLRNVVTKEPKSKCSPNIWKFDEVKKLMLEAGDVISAEEAERRVLVLENPSLRGQSRITNSLFAGIQLIMPGEIAEAHQHVSSAIRLVLDGEGAYTAVEGEKATMSRGDFILTPNWAPHDHGNPGKQPVMWLDVLDMPTVNHFETSFMTHFDEKAQNTARQDGDSLDRYGSGVLPDGTLDTFKHRSPVINYTYARTRPIIERMLKAGDIDPIRLHRRPRLDQGRRQGAELGPERRVRHPAVAALFAQCGRRVGAVLDLRQARAGSARDLAREEVSSPAASIDVFLPRRKAGHFL
jgi:gentisate 1,2-dioxygenase